MHIFASSIVQMSKRARYLRLAVVALALMVICWPKNDNREVERIFDMLQFNIDSRSKHLPFPVELVDWNSRGPEHQTRWLCSDDPDAAEANTMRPGPISRGATCSYRFLCITRSTGLFGTHAESPRAHDDDYPTQDDTYDAYPDSPFGGAFNTFEDSRDFSVRPRTMPSNLYHRALYLPESLEMLAFNYANYHPAINLLKFSVPVAGAMYGIEEQRGFHPYDPAYGFLSNFSAAAPAILSTGSVVRSLPRLSFMLANIFNVDYYSPNSFTLFDELVSEVLAPVLNVKKDDPRLSEAVSAMASANVPVCIHTAYLGLGDRCLHQWCYRQDIARADVLRYRQEVLSQIKLKEEAVAVQRLLASFDYDVLVLERKESRRIINHVSLLSMLRDDLHLKPLVVNFEEGTPMVEQMMLFHQSRIVISPHGSALAHSLWMEPGSMLIEIRLDDDHVDAFELVTEAVGITHLKWDCSPPWAENVEAAMARGACGVVNEFAETNRHDPSHWADIIVDIDELRQLLFDNQGELERLRLLQPRDSTQFTVPKSDF